MSVSLPLYRSVPIAPSPSDDDSVDVPTLDRKLILLVEDEPTVRRSTKRLLERAGHRVVDAADGIQAVAAIEDGLDPDLVLTDVVLTGPLNGRDVADQVRQTGACARRSSSSPDTRARSSPPRTHRRRSDVPAQAVRFPRPPRCRGSRPMSVVLLIEDEYALRRAMERRLSSHHEVIAAADAADAHAKHEAPPRPHRGGRHRHRPPRRQRHRPRPCLPTLRPDAGRRRGHRRRRPRPRRAGGGLQGPGVPAQAVRAHRARGQRGQRRPLAAPRGRQPAAPHTSSPSSSRPAPRRSG